MTKKLSNRRFAVAPDVKHDRGDVIVIAFQPQWRRQPTGTFLVVFNAAFFGRDVAEQATDTPAYWSAPAPAPR